MNQARRHPLHQARRFDLHLHTNRSDGKLPVDALIAQCIAGGLEAIAITDHDLDTPVPVGEHHTLEGSIYVIGGAEISGVHAGHELHLLAYFPEAIPESFRAFCKARAQARLRPRGRHGAALAPDPSRR